VVSAKAIVNSARLLLGVPRKRIKYRPWQPGNQIPMWLDDDVVGLPNPPYFLQHGVMGADLINFALVANGLPPGGGTADFANYLVDTTDFDPLERGQLGAIALRPYQDEQDNGSIALYLGPHRVIQSIPSEGVTDQYTDVETYQWAVIDGYPRYEFTIYGFLPGVSY
jgi:hypothetical protein